MLVYNIDDYWLDYVYFLEVKKTFVKNMHPDSLPSVKPETMPQMNDNIK